MSTGKRRENGLYWDRVFPVVKGCSKGCPNCWARSKAARFENDKEFRPRMNPEALKMRFPKKPTIFFTALEGDLFDPAIEDGFIMECFNLMRAYSQHIFLICTQQPKRMAGILRDWDAPEPLPHNIWLGFTARSQEQLEEGWSHTIAIPTLGVRWLSYEPAEGPIFLSSSYTYPTSLVYTFGFISMGARSHSVLRASEYDALQHLGRFVQSWCNQSGCAFWFKSAGKMKPRKLRGETSMHLPICRDCGAYAYDNKPCQPAYGSGDLGRCHAWYPNPNLKGV